MKAKELKEIALSKIGALKTDNGKKDSLAKAVKKLKAAEYDALPKALQKELKEFR